MRITVENREQTMQLGQQIGKLVMAGDVIVLSGDLGAGKTTFTKGLALGLEIDETIKSPTFTIIREYQNGRLPLYHMDVYRLENGGGSDLGLEEYFDGDGVSVVEWAQFVADELPAQFLEVHFERTEIDDVRRLELIAHGPHFEQILQQVGGNHEQ